MNEIERKCKTCGKTETGSNTVFKNALCKDCLKKHFNDMVEAATTDEELLKGWDELIGDSNLGN